MRVVKLLQETSNDDRAFSEAQVRCEDGLCTDEHVSTCVKLKIHHHTALERLQAMLEQTATPEERPHVREFVLAIRDVVLEELDGVELSAALRRR